MANPHAVVRVDRELMDGVRAYSDQTGVPAKHCVDEAVENWLSTVAPAKLRYLARKQPTEISHREIKRKGPGSAKGIARLKKA